jgi:hypothetical protein
MTQTNQTKNPKDLELFDVVVGNPPYVRHEQIKEIKSYLEKHYQTYTSTADLYVYFFERALKLLKPNGYLGYIVSNKFTRAEYGRNLRKWILENFTIVSYLDEFDGRVFEDAVVDPCVIIIKKAKAPEGHQIIYNHTQKVLQSSLSENGWSFVSEEVFSLKKKIEENGTPLKDLDVKIYRGILTGFNQAFIIDEQTKNELIKQDPKNAQIIKPLLRGRDIDRYQVNFAGQYLIVAKNGIDIAQEYPSIAEFFERKNEESGGKMENRWDKGSHWMNLRHCDYYQDFEKSKIIWTDMAQEPSFILDEKGFFMNNTVYFLSGNINLSFLLAVLNSQILKEYFNTIATDLGKTGKRYFKQFVEELPIPKATEEQQTQIAELVDEIMQLKQTSQSLADSLLNLIKAKYLKPPRQASPATPQEGNFKVSAKLKKWYELEPSEFLDELKKQKAQISLAEQSELLAYFEAEKTKVLTANNQAEAVDKQIEGLVRGLYGVES